MSTALVITGTSMRRMFRDRLALFFTLAFPVLIILIVGVSTSRFGEDSIPVGIVDHGSEPLGAELHKNLARETSIELKTYEDRESLAKAVRRGVAAAGVVVPADYDAKLRAGHSASVAFLVDQSRGFPAGIRSVISEAVSKQGAFVEAASFATKRVGRSFGANLAEARKASRLLGQTGVGVAARVVGNGNTQERTLAPGINYQAPSVLILMVFITSLAGSAALIESRRLGVIRRMLGTPTTVRSILGGVMLSRFALAGFQALFIFLVGTFVFGVKWGQPLGAAAIILLFVAVGASVGMLFGSLFSTPEQASSIGPPVGIALGMLGGCMWPIEIVPKTMQTIGHLSPHAWAMDAWIELIGRGGGLTDIFPQLAVLAAFVAVLFPLGAWRLRRVIVAG